jgi:hypothetical protein
MGKGIPNSIRIRTDDDNEYRYHAIKEAAEFYDCNRSDAVAYACDNVTQVVAAAEAILNRGNLTTDQKQEIAEEFADRRREFNVDETVTVDTS